MCVVLIENGMRRELRMGCERLKNEECLCVSGYKYDCDEKRDVS